MSYGFGMYFKYCDSEADAYLTAIKYMQEMEKDTNINAVIDRNYPVYIPSVRYGLLDYKNMYIGLQMNEYWIHVLFELNFVFWPQYNLLGLLGETWPHAEEFFSDSIYFQNSCDQDYEESTWTDICPFFDEVVAQTKSQPITRKDVFEDEEADEEEKEYYVRTKIYETIYDRLNLDLWLNGKDSDAFTRFTLNPIHTKEKATELTWKLQSKIKSAGFQVGRKDMIVYTELPPNPTVCYKLSYAADEDPTIETFKLRATKAVNDYLATQQGQAIAKVVRKEGKTAKILSLVPKYILERYQIYKVNLDETYWIKPEEKWSENGF